MQTPSATIDLVSACRQAWKNGSLEENLDLAVKSFKRAKTENGELKEDSAQHLDEAIKQYNFALQKNVEQQAKATLMLQLGKAHGNRAIATFLSPAANGQKLADYHLKLAADNLRAYRLEAQALQLPNAFEKLNAFSMTLLDRCVDVNNLGDRIFLARGMASHLLVSQSSMYNGPQLPHARLHLYIAHQYFQQALRSLDNNMDLAAPLVEMDKLTLRVVPGWRSTPKEESVVPALRGWLACRQSVTESLQALTKTAVHLRRGASENPDAHEQLMAAHAELAEQVRFCLQRSRVLIDLAGCAESFCLVTSGSEELDVQGSFDLCDSLRDVYQKAIDSNALGENMAAFEMLTSKGVDVEMECVCLHYLASVFGCVGLKARERDMHKRVVLQAMSLDTVVNDYSNPTPFLRQRGWFMKSQQYVLQAQQQDKAAQEQDRGVQLGQIKPELDAIKAAKEEGLKSFLRHVYARHTPKNGGRLDACVSSTADVPKNLFMKMLRDYHTDKIPSDAQQNEKLVFEEISKYFNHFYENDFKH